MYIVLVNYCVCQLYFGTEYLYYLLIIVYTLLPGAEVV